MFRPGSLFGIPVVLGYHQPAVCREVHPDPLP